MRDGSRSSSNGDSDGDGGERHVDVRLDDLRLFTALPTAHLVLDVDLVVRRVNPAYLRLVGRRAEDLVGRRFFDALPPDPGPPAGGDGGDGGDDGDDGDGDGGNGVADLRRSFQHVIATGEPDVLPVQRYRVIDLSTGRAVDRWWSSVTVPVLDAAGNVELLIQRVEEITDYVHDRDARRRQRRGEEQWQARALAAEVELFTRARELQVSRDGERARARELAALAEVTVRVAQTEDVAELVEVLLKHGLAALGAQGGAVAVREDDVVRLWLSSSLGRRAQSTYARLPLDSPLPGPVSAVSGRRILLPDRASALAHDPYMAEAVAFTGCQAWAVLPLTEPPSLGAPDSPGPVLGSLMIGWTHAQTFTPAVLEVLEAFAAQCSQALTRLQARQEQRAAAVETSKLSEALQRSLLSEPARPDGLQVTTRYRPAARRAQVGGDWYDSFITAAGTTTLVVGDVCGHDREAAAAMGQMRNLLRGLAYTLPAPPSQVLTLLDRALLGLDVRALATTVLVTVEQDGPGRAAGTHRLRWSNAGHPPPLLIHPDGRVELLSTPAELLLGVDADTDRLDHEVVVAAGSTLLLYTDGLVERRDAGLDAGLEWLAGTAASLAGATPEELCDRLLALVGDGAPGDEGAEDDIVLLALRT